MTDADLLAEAAAELYAGDPGAFMERRAVLAAQARAAGQAAAAKQITALRKPTHSAWLVNQLVRADPETASRLRMLGYELRSAGAALDGARIRELSQARRRLVDSLVRRALALPGAGPPSAALREELTATFGAALADPEIADQLAAGTLVRAVHRADFTPAGPSLTLVPPLAPEHRSSSPTPAPATARPRTRIRGDGQAAAGAAARADRERQRAERERQQAERERQQAIADAEQVLAGAAQATETAAAAEREQRDIVHRLEDELTEARQQLTEARHRARQAADAERAARRALGRLRD